MTSGEPPRLNKAELFRQIGYQPHPGQLVVHRSKAPRRVLACGARFGKSLCAAMEVVAAVLEPRDESTGWICAPTYDLTDRTFKLIVQTLREHFAHRIIDLNPREHRILVRNLGEGVSSLRAKSGDNPTSLLGEALDYLVVDEATRMKREIWQQHLSQRLIDKKGWALLISTPRGPGWFRQIYKRGQKGRDAQCESWSMPSWVNPYVDRATIEEEARRLPENTYRQEYGGEFIGEENEPCETCGWPDPMACTVKVFHDEETPMPKCPECEGNVDEHGRTMDGQTMTGERFFTKIIICPYPPGYDRPDLPGRERQDDDEDDA